jgi:hypothetical protein
VSYACAIPFRSGARSTDRTRAFPARPPRAASSGRAWEDPDGPRVEFFEIPRGAPSIFTGELDAKGWLLEKSLHSLEHAARAVDVVNTLGLGDAAAPLRMELHPLLWDVLKLAAFHVAHSADAFSPETHGDFMLRGLAAFDDWKRKWAPGE